MERPLVLYYNSFSFFSQRVRNCLAEKGLHYQHVKINIAAKESYEPWYMKMNPKGQVPLLKHGNKYISESLAIIKYLDDAFVQSPKLTPDLSCEEGILSQQICDLCRKVSIPMVTFAIQRFPDMFHDPLIPEKVRKYMLERMTNAPVLKKDFLRKAEKYPDLREAYLNKAKDVEVLMRFADDPNMRKDIEIEIGKCKAVFDFVEKQIQKNVEASPVFIWLCGTNYSLADIEVGILMQRLRVSGLAKSTWMNGNYPRVEKYFKQLCERTSFKECSYNVGPTTDMWLYAFRSTFPKVALSVGVAMMAVIGYYAK